MEFLTQQVAASMNAGVPAQGWHFGVASTPLEGEGNEAAPHGAEGAARPRATSREAHGPVHPLAWEPGDTSTSTEEADP